MELKFIGQGLDPESDITAGNFILNSLESENYKSFNAFVAFVSTGGLKNIIDQKSILEKHKKLETLPDSDLRKAKEMGFSDFQIARFIFKDTNEYMEEGLLKVRDFRIKKGIVPVVKQIDNSPARCQPGGAFLMIRFAVPTLFTGLEPLPGTVSRSRTL